MDEKLIDKSIVKPWRKLGDCAILSTRCTTRMKRIARINMGSQMSETTFEIKKDGKTLVHIPLWNFPEKSQLRECYETENEIVILGERLDDHDCDVMGCSTCFHVRYRFPKGSHQGGHDED